MKDKYIRRKLSRIHGVFEALRREIGRHIRIAGSIENCNELRKSDLNEKKIRWGSYAPALASLDLLGIWSGNILLVAAAAAAGPLSTDVGRVQDHWHTNQE